MRVCVELKYVGTLHRRSRKTVIFHFVAVLLVTNQGEKGATDSMNCKSSTTKHKQLFSCS